MKNTLFISSFMLVSLLLLATACSRDKIEPVLPGECIEGVEYSFNTNIKPIIIRTCTNGSNCHNATGQGDYAQFSVLSNDLHNDANGFTERVFELRDMPEPTQPSDLQLTPSEFDKLRCWMEEGYPEN